MLKNIRVGIVIPWREQKQRLEPFKIVNDHYESFFSDKDVFLVDSEDATFSRARSINLGLDHFFKLGYDVVVVNDADTISELESLNNAIQLAYDNEEIVLPYDNYTYFIDGREINLKVNKDDISFLSPSSGSLVIPSSVYKNIKGFDENFIDWGPEDQEFHYRYWLFYGKKFGSVAGNCHSFFHGSLKINEQIVKNHEYACTKYPESSGLKKCFESFKASINHE